MIQLSLDYATLYMLRQSHPAWRLLRSDHAPLVAGFLHRVFNVPNVRVIAQSDLTEAFEDEICLASAPGADEALFDLTPPAEKAIAWLATLAERSFLDTESRHPAGL